MSAIRVGDRFIGVADQLDGDEDGEDRITRAGSVWVVRAINSAFEAHIGCPETGGWIVPTLSDPEDPAQFTRVAA